MCGGCVGGCLCVCVSGFCVSVCVCGVCVCVCVSYVCAGCSGSGVLTWPLQNQTYRAH